MRLIDADALDERMYHDAFETNSDMQKWDSGCWIRYKMFERAIEDAPTIEPEPQWISCIESNPPKTNYYICTCNDGTTDRVSCIKWVNGWVLTGRRTFWKIKAWMPLPEPWRGDKE